MASICPSPVVSIIMVENQINGLSIFTDEILLNGIVVYWPLNRLGILNVTDESSIIILVGNILLPSVNLDAV